MRANENHTAFDKILEAAIFIVFALMWYDVLTSYASLPERIPVHFDIYGKTDAYGSKSSLFLLPFIATAVYLLFAVLKRFPHKLNYPVEVTEENAAQVYKTGLRFLRYLNLLLLFSFFYLSHKTITVAVSGKSDSGALGLLFLPLGIITSVIYFVIKLGTIKTPRS